MENRRPIFFMPKFLKRVSLNAILVTLGILLFVAAIYCALDHSTFRAFFISRIEALRNAITDDNNASIKVLSLQVSGMTCGGCETKVKTAIMTLEGVQKVEVSHQQNLANVVVDSQKVDAQALIEAITKAGYFATRKSL